MSSSLIQLSVLDCLRREKRKKNQKKEISRAMVESQSVLMIVVVLMP